MAASREAPNVILPFDWDNSTKQREWSEVPFVSIKDHLELVCNCLLDPDALMVVCGLALLPLQSGALLSNPIATLPESTFVSLASLKPIHPNLVPLLSRTLSTLTGPQVVLRLLNHLQRALRWETPKPPLFFLLFAIISSW